MEWLSLLADIVGITGALFALLAWVQARRVRQALERERQRQNRKVTVILQSGPRQVELPVELRRAELTRAEVLGRIGMITGKDRFSVGYLKTPEFMRQLGQILESDGDARLTIHCTEEELRLFEQELSQSLNRE